MLFNLLAEAQTDGFHVARTSNSKSGQYNGACILGCKGVGNDRLRIQPNQGDYGWFICEHCNSKGTGIDWLIIKRGMSKNEALQAVGWKPKDGSELHFTIPSHVLSGQTQSTHEAPSQTWQESAKAFAKYCVDLLWDDQGKEALAWLRGRGLIDETIKAAQIGYNPNELKRAGERWGLRKPVVLAKGITIPWFVGGDLWRITIRDESVLSGDGRYKQVAGGSNGLYLADYLHYNRPVIVAEGELDALSIAQECGKHVITVATGTTSGSHTTHWIAELARKERVFIAFDAEKDKGDKQANWWIERLEHAQRLRPLWGDANQMLQDGVRLWDDWIQPGIEAEQEDLCSVCHKAISTDQGIDGFYSADGKYTCSAHVVRPAARDQVIPHDDREDRTPVRSVEEYWARTRRKLKGIDFTFVAPVIKARTYPGPFPCRQLVSDQDGRMHLKIVGTWHPTECRLMNDSDSL